MHDPKPHAVPLGLGMVLADFIWRDPGTGKCTILGTFDTVCSNRFPCQHPPMGVFCVLSDGRGKVQLALRVVEAADPTEEPLVAMTREVEFRTPRSTVQLSIGLPPITFPREGEYRVQLRCAGEVVMERRLLVHGPQREPSSAGPADGHP
jgi:uncharacterized protein DUF6941